MKRPMPIDRAHTRTSKGTSLFSLACKYSTKLGGREGVQGKSPPCKLAKRVNPKRHSAMTSHNLMERNKKGCGRMNYSCPTKTWPYLPHEDWAWPGLASPELGRPSLLLFSSASFRRRECKGRQR